jgi:hypothetical protein
MINLLPYKEKKSIERIRNVLILKTLFLGGVILSAISIVLMAPTFIAVKSRFSIVKDQMVLLERTGMVAKDVDLTKLEKDIQFVKGKLSAAIGVQPTRYIDIVAGAVPVGIKLDRFSSDDTGSLELYGISSTREVLQSFIKTLESDPHIATVDSPVTNFIKNKNNTFRLTISFK